MRNDRTAIVGRHRTADRMMSRRVALGSCAVTALGWLPGSAPGQTQEEEADAKKPTVQPSKESQGRMEQSRALAERMRNAESAEERQQIMNEQMAWQRQQAIENLKKQLGLSDREWAVVKPRLQAVYDLTHPRPPMMGRPEPPKTEVEQRSRELRELLRDEKAAADQIRTKLAAFRAAKERAVQQLTKARQSLRQVMTLRQEALLVLNGLLD